MTNWRILAARSLGESAVNDGVFRAAVLLIGALAIAGAVLLRRLSRRSRTAQHEAFRLLQFGLAVPTLIFAVSLVGNACGAQAGRRIGPGAIRRSSPSRCRSPCSRSAA